MLAQSSSYIEVPSISSITGGASCIHRAAGQTVCRLAVHHQASASIWSHARREGGRVGRGLALVSIKIPEGSGVTSIANCVFGLFAEFAVRVAAWLHCPSASIRSVEVRNHWSKSRTLTNISVFVPISFAGGADSGVRFAVQAVHV